MVEPLDFTLGTVVGTIIGVIVAFVANYLTEVLRERKRHDRVVRAFIRELTMIKDDVKLGTSYKSMIVGTPVFSKLITELPLLRELTAEQLLNTYSDIKFYIRRGGVMMSDDAKELVEAIETSIEFLTNEVKHRSWHRNKRRLAHDR
jgi:hypothetical protein